MKILWITNILFPEAISLLAENDELKASGGWMLGMAEAMVNQDGVELSVASVSRLVSSLTIVKGRDITYYVIPLGKGNIRYNKEYEPYWREVYSKSCPDLVHIHGTEYSHGLAFVNACPTAKTVISIQGLTSVYGDFYSKGIGWTEIIKNITFRDIIFRDTLFSAKRKFRQRGEKIEKPMLRQVQHIMGRTSWDRAHAWAINPKATYHFCNETLRHEFYDGSCWIYDKCSKHTIFLSQAGYPIKGVHQVIKALPLILKEFPKAKVLVAGRDITRRNTLKECLLFSGYGKLICKLIRKYNLEGHIEFLGPLNAEEMKQAYLHCNVFVCPSTIENSPNSLGEAQVLGVPCIASYVGGIPDMIPEEDCGKLYRFEEVKMLAYHIIDLFNNSQTFDNSRMREIALQRHDRDENASKLIQIYRDIITSNNND